MWAPTGCSALAGLVWVAAQDVAALRSAKTSRAIR